MKLITILENFSTEVIPPQKVKPKMKGRDYNDEGGIVLKIVKSSDWQSIKNYSTSGWLNDDSKFNDNDYLVVVNGPAYGMFGGKGTEVFIYGTDGFAVYK